MTKGLMRLLRDKRGGTAIEYGLIASMVVIAMLVALQNVANKTSTMWNSVSNKVNAAS